MKDSLCVSLYFSRSELFLLSQIIVIEVNAVSWILHGHYVEANFLVNVFQQILGMTYVFTVCMEI